MLLMAIVLLFNYLYLVGWLTQQAEYPILQSQVQQLLHEALFVFHMQSSTIKTRQAHQN